MPGNSVKGKRKATVPSTGQKKRKLNNGKQASSKGKGSKKEKAADRGVIPIPNLHYDEDALDLSDQDMEFLTEFGKGTTFLTGLDHKGLMRSKKETQRLHELTKPVRKASPEDDLPSMNSDTDEEDEYDWDSNIDGLSSNASHDLSLPTDSESEASDDSRVEMPYELAARKRPVDWDTGKKIAVRGLPIKLADGKVKDTGVKVPVSQLSDSEEEESSDESEAEAEAPSRVEDVATGARFGRPAVVDVLQTKSRKQKVEMAKEQIAGICQEILSDPENSLGLLRRLHTFALATVTTPTQPDPVPNDTIIRQLALLSQLSIFKDIIPGYRIRALTDAEKSEKVSQMVARTRDWEQGLVTVYQTYLRLLEKEIKSKSQLSDVALHCMCTLLIEVTHFNFRVNLMTCIVSRLSKKSWDETSKKCLDSLITVLREDLTGLPSLEIVRLLNRMVKERHFKVHPNVLSCLLHLRLRTELGVRASDKYADKPETRKGKHSKEKKAQQVHLSKKTRKVLKEQKEINKDLREAEAEVDKDERRTTQTETLKLLFALYFRILKNPTQTPLLPSALSGISRFAHLVNIDFFKDLMTVLKDLIAMEEQALTLPETGDTDQHPLSEKPLNTFASTSRRLMCIVTAFELLSGQGEALNIDLSEFVSSLYSMLLPLTLIHGNDPQPSLSRHSSSANPKTTAGFNENPCIPDLLFRALNLIFSPRTSGVGTKSSFVVGVGASSGTAERAAAFAKRLLSSSLHSPSSSVVLRTLEFVRTLVAQHPKLEAMLSTEDRIFNGVYKPEVDDPQLCNPFETSFWEVHVLHQRHWDPRVREEAGKLLNFVPQ
ncbi:nucleolar complex-associated protein-domain-containing protein [Crepidotus variabilis]|uniref:Nucleolar complex-associated protein 3 n=1 Tax=Crepidotus variabilis TaxID=179855 RepID=A0A9P6EN87_9AGAR|nr:nucleolar complex-associated protein-domain-containing protein [Crepidotus variabilis]